MDFDEYDYLEKTVENPDLPNEANGGGGGGRSDDKSRSRSSRHGADRDGEGEGRSKRAKVDDDGGGGGGRRRSSPERGERREKERGRGGGERRERERRDRDGGKDRDKERSRDKDREKERRERDGRERDRARDRPRSGELKEREREKEFKDRDRDGRRHKEKKDEEAEVDPERDQRTVFAYQICLKADERDVYEFFSRAGKVRDVRLIMDRNSRRSKGVGYIEFYDVMSVPMAIALSGQLLLGQPVMVKPSEAEKNLVQSTTAASAGAGARKLYVGNLHFSITEEQLRQVFEPFGTVELVQLPLDTETGQCKGFGFIQFARLEDARAAQSLNGQLDIAGRMIKVSAVTDQVGMQEVGANAADFDDDDGGGLSLNARSRAILMQKLDRTGTATSIVGSLGNPAVNGSGIPLSVAPALGGVAAAPLVPGLGQISGPGALPTGAVGISQTSAVMIPTECLLLTNMFDPNVESEPDFDLDIKEDVQEECSKHGPVKHIFVDKNSDGHVYLRFDATTSAISAQRALNGRWFAGKQILATFMLPQNYEAKFPDSK